MLHYVKKNKWLLLKLTLTVILLLFLINYIKLENIILYLRKCNLTILVLAFFLWPVGDYFKIKKWVNLVRIHEPKYSFYNGIQSFYSGITLALVTPFSVGELTRASFIKSKYLKELTGKTLLDKTFDLLTVIFLSLMSILIITNNYYFLIIPAIIFLFIILLFTKRIILNITKINFLNFSKINTLKKITEGFIGIPLKLTIYNGVLTLFFFIIFYIQIFLVLLSYDTNSPIEIITVFPLITLSTILPITISGIGIRETTAVLLLKNFNIPEAIAFNAFLMHFIMANVIPGLLGLYFILRNKIKKQQNEQ